MTGNTLSAAAGQLRQSALVRGRGWPQLLKGVQPAAGANYLRPVDGGYWERLVSLAFNLTTSAAVADRTVALNMLDGDGNIFNQTLIASAIPAGVSLSEYGDLSQPTSVQTAESPAFTGTQTSPAAGTVIAGSSVAQMPAGEYSVTVYFQLAGTVAQAVDANNIQLLLGTDVINLDNNISTAEQQFGPFTMLATGANSISLKNIATATTGAIYSATIQVNATLQQAGFQFPDLLLKSGYSFQIVVGNIQAADQISGILLYLERYPSSDYQLPEGDLARDLAAVLASHGIG